MSLYLEPGELLNWCPHVYSGPGWFCPAQCLEDTPPNGSRTSEPQKRNFPPPRAHPVTQDLCRALMDAASQVDVNPHVKGVAKGAGKVTFRDCVLAVVGSVLPAKWKAFDFHYIPDSFGDTVTCPSYGKRRYV